MTNINSALNGKYPAKAHAKRVAEFIAAAGAGGRDGVIYLESQKTHMNEDNDQQAPFRQRRPFFYLSGCELPDSYLTYNIATTELTLYIPPIDPDDVIWSGLPKSPEEALKEYDVDAVFTTANLNACLTKIASSLTTTSTKTIYAIPEQVSEHVTFNPFEKTDFSILKKAIDYTRVVKDDFEIALIRKANEVSADAHAAVYEKAPTAKTERELHAIFISTCICGGCDNQAYDPIVASGTNAATLHYVKNNEKLIDKENLLIDAGGEYRCYAADVTRTFPLSGKWSKESKEIYDTVHEMQEVSFEMLKEGVLWEDVHAAAHKVAIKRLKQFGILVGDEQEIFDKRISVAFFPHGLGHYLGMDTHDTGGNANYEDKDSMFKYLRVRGTLPAGCVITVEPGVYFCRFIIEPYLKDAESSKYINKIVLDKYWKVGGVRIEDDVVITKNGFENLTTAFKL
ncbi:putative prolidase [Phaeomoniella chlamydospora]|uniref:Probable Xaa-Pro aminopeptidase PEPP n=1 Tax=Phaeomoniella chlamydospora TaxID=158046 RepID=A0A0G2FRM9_PHACM|nr:putative prolidase [Phaeomoniella chlamydospora]